MWMKNLLLGTDVSSTGGNGAGEKAENALFIGLVGGALIVVEKNELFAAWAGGVANEKISSVNNDCVWLEGAATVGGNAAWNPLCWLFELVDWEKKSGTPKPFPLEPDAVAPALPVGDTVSLFFK